MSTKKMYLMSFVAASVAAAISGQSLAIDLTDVKHYSPEITHTSQNDKVIKGSQLKQAYPNYFIVQLEQAPLSSIVSVQAQNQAKPGNKLDMTSEAAKSQVSLLKAERAAFAKALSAKFPNAKMDRHYDTIMNAVVVASDTNIYDSLLTMPGVTAVYKEEMYYESMDASLDIVKAQQVWASLGGSANAGQGVKIAIIDGGIRPENPMFAGENFTKPTDLPTTDYCNNFDPSFCNDKVIVARYSTPTFVTHPDEYMSPLGLGGHGTHVAGTAAGNPVSIKFNGTTEIVPEDSEGNPNEDGFSDVTISGVAPGAYIMAYKALFQTPANRGSGSNVMLLEALDWAVKDGADVINNSWGGGAGGDPATSPYQAAFQAAEEAGVVVVTAAGNDGPGAQTIGCPSCIESGLSVASTTHGRFFANTIQVNGGNDILAIASSGSGFNSLEEDITADFISAKAVAPDNALGCNPFPVDTFKDSVALISRGACAFTNKIDNAMNAGAAGVVVYNSAAGLPITMSAPTTTLPAVMISKASGENIEMLLEDEAAISVIIDNDTKRVVDSEFADLMSDFSSRGPNGDSGSLKPDIAAPGSSILSATSPDENAAGSTFGLKSGTSMASPHVAGAAAIMKQLHPDWSAVEIKTALTSSSVFDGMKKEDGSTPATPFDIGAGRLDLTRATTAALTFDKPSWAQDPCIATCDVTRALRNMSDTSETWTATVTFDDVAIDAELSDDTFTLGAFGSETDSADFTLTVDASASTYGTWQFGRINFTSNDNSVPTATMPIALYVSETPDAATISTTGTGTLRPAEPIDIAAFYNNKTFTDQISVEISAPQGTKIVADSESSDVANGTEYLLDASDQRLAWTGKLEVGRFTMENFAGMNTSIKDLGVAPYACAGECDEFSVTYNLGGLGGYVYNGNVYNSITVGDNGIVIAGGGATTGSFENQEMPSSAAPNNVLAAMWADFDLAGGAGGAGTLHVGLVSGYVVFEWNDVELWNNPAAGRFTFQTWVKLGGTEQDIFFDYLKIDSVPANVTIGAEDASGSTGISRFYNGTGTAPMVGTAIGLTNVVGGNLQLRYQLENDGMLDLGAADSITVDEDAVSEAKDVLANDAAVATKVINVKVMSGGESMHAVNKVNVGADGVVSGVTIVTAPSNGTAAVDEAGMIIYTPAANFNGTDSFTYSAADESGIELTPTVVNVVVTPVNDAPTLTAGAAKSVAEGESVTLNVTGTDIDGDTLTYTWTQTAGPSVGVTSTSNSATFNAPSVENDSTITFSVVVSDGTATSSPVTVSATVTNKKSSGGALGWLTLLLVPLAAMRKRRKMRN
ncbi:S8 family serine peptidase [Arsukibacterium sp. UBA3155]|uniref:S8 family serine peptidase n=1 Tax=Arsukibacterium sp. UBA3155 TaxID=1946058 RepID=UPI0025C691B9|nr:S8 family serine peptidase [Arsukibacterium sp. UBA3155]